jgi:hypothetical protein
MSRSTLLRGVCISAHRLRERTFKTFRLLSAEVLQMKIKNFDEQGIRK